MLTLSLSLSLSRLNPQPHLSLTPPPLSPSHALTFALTRSASSFPTTAINSPALWLIALGARVDFFAKWVRCK
jgi:hypothetical protein